MKPKNTWIVIADGARARIVCQEGKGGELKPALDHEFAASHAPTRDWVSDRPGSYADRGGLGTHQFAPKTDRHDHEKVRFTGDVGRILEKAAEERKFDRLILVAPPAVLGLLRAALGKQAEGRVVAEVSKDFTHLPVHALADHLSAWLEN